MFVIKIFYILYNSCLTTVAQRYRCVVRNKYSTRWFPPCANNIKSKAMSA